MTIAKLEYLFSNILCNWQSTSGRQFRLKGKINFKVVSILSLLLLLLNMSQQCKVGREHSINLKTPTSHNQPVEGRKRENSRRQNKTADYASKKTLALLLKIASTTPSNTGS